MAEGGGTRATATDGSGALDRFTALFAPGERTLPAMLRRQAERYGARRLFVVGETTWSFREALAVAAGTARRLQEAGIAPGERVAILCGNGPALMQVYLGCAFAGVVAVPINTASRGAQLQHILSNCGARLACLDAALLPSLAGLDRAALALEKLWLVGTPTEAVPAGLSAEPVPLPDTAIADDRRVLLNDPHAEVPDRGSGLEAPLSRSAGALLRGRSAAPQEVEGGTAPHPVRPGDTVAILYTSGTTGLSKGVCCPQAQYFWWGAHTAALLGLGEGEVLLTTLPLFHTNALNSFYQALLTGSTLVAEPRFSVSDFTAALRRHRATATYVLGAMVPMLLSRPPSPDDADHGVRIALAPGVPAEFQGVFTKRFGIGLIDGYGSTETNFVVGDLLADQRPGTMGRVRPGFSARVMDEEDNAVAPGTPGELVLRADEPFAFATGYFAMADKTVEAWRNLWFHTGDRVVAEADGRLRFLDRMKDAIRRRGENVSSFEVEQVIAAHPAVANAAVFPVRSELAEDEVMAAVVLHPGAALTPVALLDHCSPRMPYFAVPRYLAFVDALPTTENGKVQKFKLREEGITPETFDRERVGYKVQR